jgi:hypothetical protein
LRLPLGNQRDLLQKNRDVAEKVFTYNVAISLCPLMCFFPIERFNAANHRRQKAERGTSAAFCRPSAFVLLGMIGFFPLSE